MHSANTSGTSFSVILRAKALGDRRLADTRITDKQGVVLGAPAQHLDGALNLPLPPDQRIGLSGLCLLVEIDAVGLERLVSLADLPLALLRSAHNPGF